MHAELSLSLPVLFGFLLVLARVGGALVFVPLPGVKSGPEVARIVLSLGFAVALFPFWRAVPAMEAGAGWMLAALAGEAAFGITIGVAISFLIEAVVLAGQMVGLQAGYSYASTVDPSTEADSSVIQVFASILAGLLFFSLGMDRQVVRIFARSLEVWPPGEFVPRPSSVDFILRLGAGMFSTGLRLAMPVISLLVLVDIALALLGRINAHLQLLTLAFPAKMLAALALLAAISAVFLPVYRGAAEQTITGLGPLFAP